MRCMKNIHNCDKFVNSVDIVDRSADCIDYARSLETCQRSKKRTSTPELLSCCRIAQEGDIDAVELSQVLISII